MPPINRFPPYVIAAAALFMITFYHVYNVRSKNSDLQKSINIFKEALQVSKEKNKVLVKDALEKIDKREARIKELEQQNLFKHTKLGEKQSKLSEMRSELEMKNKEIKKLHQLAAEHKAEIKTLGKSVSKSKDVLTKLSEKADHLMVDHKKLKKDNTELKDRKEKLQSLIKQQQSEKATFDDKLSSLKIENQNLRVKVDDLTRKNEVIQESIKQKIKESYAARRVMTRPPKMTEATDKQSTLETPQDSIHKLPTFRQHAESEQHKSITDIPDEKQNISKVKVDNFNTGNVSRFMVDNSDDNQHNNISRIMVDNSEYRQKRNMVSDAFVDKQSTTQSSIVGGDESLNNASLDKFLTEDKTTKSLSDSIDVNSPVHEHFGDNRPGFQPEIVTPEQGGENVEQGKQKNEDFEDENTNIEILGDFKQPGPSNTEAENDDINQESPSEHKDGNLETENEDMNRESLSEGNRENVFEKRTRAGKTLQENSNIDKESLSKDTDENLKQKTENEDVDRENPSEESKEGVSEMKTDSDTLPVFPKIEDEAIDRQNIESPREYGEHKNEDVDRESPGEENKEESVYEMRTGSDT